MDDPWGSPWATTESDPNHRPPSPIKSSLEPPPRAFLTSNSPRLGASSAKSPWENNDDGFGDWASADAPAWGGWSGSETLGPNHQLAHTPRDEVFGKTNQVAWPGNAATSPSVKTISRSHSNSLFRQPSPDPWSTEFDPETTTNAQREPSPVRLDPPVERPLPSSLSSTTEVVSSTGHELRLSGPSDITSPRWEGTEEPRRSTVEVAGQKSKNEEKEGCFVRESVSRPSSSCSGVSRGDEGRQDSPISSIDEDSRTRPQSSQRKVSSKVQELVEMYDGLARTRRSVNVEGEAHAGSSTSSADYSTQPADEGEIGDRDDDNGANSARNPEAMASVEPKQSLPTRTPTPTTPQQALSLQSQPTSPQDYKSPGHHPEAFPSKLQELVAQFGSIQFEASVENLDELFDKTTLDSTCPVHVDSASSFVPDHVLTDSFISISERKTWYRISRQGSSRKHNVGDDENYRRVVWPSSAVSTETMKVVRRWMEEDSIAGRPKLGGGSKGNMFGWDSSAEPVALDQVFGKSRAALRRGQAPSVKSAAANAVSHPIPGIGPAPGFSWSMGPSISPVAAITNPLTLQAKQEELRSASPTTKPIFVQEDLSGAWQISLSLQAPVAHEATLTTGGNQWNNDEDNDEDDDWGEMVSSPHSVTRPSLSGPVAFADVLTTDSLPASQPTHGKPRASKTDSDKLAPGIISGSVNQPDGTQPISFPFAGGRSGLLPQNGAPQAKSPSKPKPLAEFNGLGPAEYPMAQKLDKKTAPPSKILSQQKPDATLHVPNLTSKTVRAVTMSPRAPSPPPTRLKASNPEQDALIENIITALPSLAYMLR